MTSEQQLQVDGFRAHLAIAGTVVTTNDGQRLTVLIEDIGMLAEPFETARARDAVFCNITALSADIQGNRSITQMREDSGRTFRIVKVRDGQDVSFREFMAEVQRT